MPGWLLPAIGSAIGGILGRSGGGRTGGGFDWASAGMAAAGVGGGMLNNAAARREAERNRAFQERMSSTSAQRGAADYAAAGFNPALAYDKPASSPGGSMAQVEDAVGKGLSSGMQAKAMRAQIELLQEQARKAHFETNIAAADATVRGAQAAPWAMDGPGTLRDLYYRNQREDLSRQLASQPHQLQQLIAMMQLQQAMVPGARAEADWWKNLDGAGSWVKGLAPLLRLIRPR